MDCRHTWVAGLMHVDLMDLAEVARVRTVECEACELTVGPDTAAAVISNLMWGEE